MDTANLTEIEFDGVLSQLFGYVYCRSAHLEAPSDFTHTDDETNEFVLIESLKDTIYADAFSKMCGTTDGLTGSLEKYLRSPSCNNSEIIIERINRLKAIRS